ncbi:MAG: acyltransferase family protein, partial [Mycobacteriales bacterium]
MTAEHSPAPAPVEPGLQAARALAVSLVLWAHLTTVWMASSGMFARRTSWETWRLVETNVVFTFSLDHQSGGHLGLLLFFLVSGYVGSLAADRDTRSTFLLKRAARLLPAMVLSVLATLVVAYAGRRLGWPAVFGITPDGDRPLHVVFESLGLAPTVFGHVGLLFVLWTLNIEYYWYLLVGLVIPRGSGRVAVAGTYGLLAGLVALYEVCTRVPFSATHVRAGDLLYVIFIVIGRWIYLGQHKVISESASAIGVVATIGLHIALRWPNETWDIWYVRGHRSLMAIAWAVLIFCLLLRFVRRRIWRPVALVADISYGL